MGVLPGADDAIVPLEKLRDYSLDSFHPTGKHKARVFESALGMTQNDASRLREMILRAILVTGAVSQDTNIHGTRYIVDFPTLGMKGPVMIRTAWIIDVGVSVPRLTSCYVIG